MHAAARPPEDILRIEGLKKYFPIRRGFLQRTVGWVRAVEDVSFAIGRATTLGLVGESGCGKTTVARLILNLLPCDGGRIVFKGTDIAGMPERDMKPFRKEVQIIFQDPYGSLNPRMTVGQTIGEGLRAGGSHRRAPGGGRLVELLAMVGLSASAAERYPHEFSGGQRQRIGIARALSVAPSLIICDEPVSALDVSIQAQIINLLKDLQDRLGLSFLFISHDLNVVGYLCHQVAVMYKGQIMEYAPADTLFENARHPYTHLLLSAVPDPFSGRRLDAERIEADAAENGLAPPEGCRFQTRCPQEDERCRRFAGELTAIGEGHFVRCWRAG
jgi:oligopeptide/dipeptide ABC transporter ATP-binding protein